jgi:hypothetical protein
MLLPALLEGRRKSFAIRYLIFRLSPSREDERETQSTAANAAFAEAVLSQEEVAVAAYYRAQARGFEPGNELEDWLGAEREIAAGTVASVVAD